MTTLTNKEKALQKSCEIYFNVNPHEYKVGFFGANGWYSPPIIGKNLSKFNKKVREGYEVILVQYVLKSEKHNCYQFIEKNLKNKTEKVTQVEL